MPLMTLAAECEGCGARTFDYMDAGWWVLKGELTKYVNRDPEKTAVVELFISNTGERFFCSRKCFLQEK